MTWYQGRWGILFASHIQVSPLNGRVTYLPFVLQPDWIDFCTVTDLWSNQLGPGSTIDLTYILGATDQSNFIPKAPPGTLSPEGGWGPSKCLQVPGEVFLQC